MASVERKQRRAAERTQRKNERRGNGAPARAPSPEIAARIAAAGGPDAAAVAAQAPPDAQALLARAGSMLDKAEREAGEKKPPSKTKAARLGRLEHELAILLEAPAVLFEGAGDEFCAEHFSSQGEELARVIVRYAEDRPATLKWLERAAGAGGIVVVAIAVAAYALPPMIHHGIIPAPDGLRQHYGVPMPPPVHVDAWGEPDVYEAAAAADDEAQAA